MAEREAQPVGRVETVEADTLITAVQDAVRRFGCRWHFAEPPLYIGEKIVLHIVVSSDATGSDVQQ